MTLADSATTALALTAVLAVVARLVGALTTDGAVAGAVVGACVSLGFGLPGLAVLGTFFVVGTAATRVGWEKKKARGTAEAGEGRRDWKRVVGKGGVAAAAALWCASRDVRTGSVDEQLRLVMGLWLAFTSSVAAALADTLGTEIGTLARRQPRLLPLLRRVPPGTPGGVSVEGLAAAACGAAIVAVVAREAFGSDVPTAAIVWICASGIGASLAESLAVGLGLRAPGFARNLFATAAGAALGCSPLFFTTP